MSETFMDRLIVDLKNHSHPYVTSFNGAVGDLVVTIPQVVTGVYTCTGNQNGELIYIDHAQNKVPDMVFAVIEYGGTSELTTPVPISLFCFATVPLVNGVLSTTQISVLLPDVDTSGSTRVKWTAVFKDNIPASNEYTREEIDDMLLNIESQIEQLEDDTTTEQTNYSNHLTDETAHSVLLNARASVESVDTLSTNVTALEQMVTEKEQQAEEEE